MFNLCHHFKYDSEYSAKHMLYVDKVNMPVTFITLNNASVSISARKNDSAVQVIVEQSSKEIAHLYVNNLILALLKNDYKE